MLHPTMSLLARILLPAFANAADNLDAHLKKLRLPEGFRIEVLARVPGARAMAISTPPASTGS